MLLADARQKPGDIDERDERDIEAVARPDESRGLRRRVDVESTREDGRLLGHDADAPTGESREPDDDVLRPRGLNLEELAVVDHARDDVMHVVGPRGIVRDDRVELRILAIGRIGGRANRGVREIVLRQVRQDLPGQVESGRLIGGREVSDPAPGRVDTRAAEALGVDLLVGDRSDDVRARDEHVARPFHHDGEVGDRR
ncbi:MAG TPA: hypothetical protein VFO73_07975 [Candidatus Limnocylindrales bacterium]|nr:hypothetical protein [Candidatus Limnocylindrales bacterium]